jgi:hypothetical protein
VAEFMARLLRGQRQAGGEECDDEELFHWNSPE